MPIIARRSTAPLSIAPQAILVTALVAAVIVGGSVIGVPTSATPREYVAYRAATAPTLDGRLDEASWQATPWTDDFLDIQGPALPAPRHRTRAKMMWDADNFYIAAELDEPHLWATLTERDSVIFYDNDFEVFIDPDGDTHAYYELEVNALGTEWDLMLLKPYRDGGGAIDNWDIAGLEIGFDLRGTLNDPTDQDEGWTVEIAMPWLVLEEAAVHEGPPLDGETWRVNFSRVQWRLDANANGYAKMTDPITGDVLPEDNWVWSPQGAIAMHRPEHWGYVQFSTTAPGATVEFVADPDAAVRAALRDLYYQQSALLEEVGRYARELADLSMPVVEGAALAPRMEQSAGGWIISAPGQTGARVFIRDDGKTWTER
jgi:hypothetical protein